jgi:glutaredoxin 3
MPPPEITVYTTPSCPHCLRVKRLLESKGVAFHEVDLSEDAELRQEMVEKTGWLTAPMVFIGDIFVGGSDEIQALDREEKLDAMLQGEA